MPCYKLLVWSRPEANPAELATTFRSLARLVYREQGQFRTLQNLGVRPLAWPIALPYEKFDEARLVQCTFDISPSGKSQLESFLKGNDSVLSFSHLRDRSKLAAFSRGTKKVRTKPVTAKMLRQGMMLDPATMKVSATAGPMVPAPRPPSQLTAAPAAVPGAKTGASAAHESRRAAL